MLPRMHCVRFLLACTLVAMNVLFVLTAPAFASASVYSRSAAEKRKLAIKRQFLPSGSTQCLPAKEDEFEPNNGSLIFPPIPLPESAKLPAGTNISALSAYERFMAASKYVLNRIQAPVLTPVLISNGPTREAGNPEYLHFPRIDLPSLYLCAEDSFLFAVASSRYQGKNFSSGPSTSSTSSTSFSDAFPADFSIVDVRAEYEAGSAFVSMRLDRVVLPGDAELQLLQASAGAATTVFANNTSEANSTVSSQNFNNITFELVGKSTSIGWTDRTDVSREAVLSLQSVSAHDRPFGLTFFMVTVQIASSYGVSTPYKLSVSLTDPETVCGSGGARLVEEAISAAPAIEAAGRTAGSVVRTMPVVPRPSGIVGDTITFASDVSVCVADDYALPSRFPIPQTSDKLVFSAVPAFPLRGDTFRIGDTDLTLFRNGSLSRSLQYEDITLEQITAPTPHQTEGSSAYTARIATVGTGGDLPQRYIFSAVRCTASSFPPTVYMNPPARWDAPGAAAVGNQSLCGTTSRLVLDVSNFLNTSNTSDVLWIEIFRSDVDFGGNISEPLIGAPLLDVTLRSASLVPIVSFRSASTWRPNAIAIPRSNMSAADSILITIQKQLWYSRWTFVYMPSSPIIRVRAFAAPPASDVGLACLNITVGSVDIVPYLPLCASGTTVINIEPPLRTSLSASGYDLEGSAIVLASSSYNRDDVELLIEGRIPSLEPFYNGTSLQHFKRQATVKVPSVALAISNPRDGERIIVSIKNPHGLPVAIRFSTLAPQCSPDLSYRNRLSDFLAGNYSGFPVLRPNPDGSGVTETPYLASRVCRLDAAFWVLEVADADIIAVGVIFESFGGNVDESGVLEFNVDQLGVSFFDEKGAFIDGDESLSTVTYYGRTFDFRAAKKSPKPQRIFVKISTVGAATGRYSLSIMWRKQFESIRGAPVWMNASHVSIESPSATSLTTTTTASDATGSTAGATDATPSGPDRSFELIAGIVVGVIVVAVACIVGIVVCLVRRTGSAGLFEPVEANVAGSRCSTGYADSSGGYDQLDHGTFFRGPEGNSVELTTMPSSSAAASRRFLDGVRLEKLIGEGNFGAVYRAIWRSTPVAAKTVDNVAEIIAELAVLERIDHPNCVHFLGCCRATTPNDGIEREFMIFELAEGSVLSVLQAGPVPLARKLVMLRDAARGLAYLGGMGIVHRDLACRNLLVDRNRTLISDFGLSRKYDEFYSSSASSVTAMPIRWTAPEILRQGKAQPASDLYSFGVMTWEMLEGGNKPFAGLSNADVMNVATRGRVAEYLTRPANTPDSLWQLMMRLWNPEPAARPTIGDVLDTLDRLIQSAVDTGELSQQPSRASATPAMVGANLPGYSSFPISSGESDGAHSASWTAGYVSADHISNLDISDASASNLGPRTSTNQGPAW